MDKTKTGKPYTLSCGTGFVHDTDLVTLAIWDSEDTIADPFADDPTTFRGVVYTYEAGATEWKHLGRYEDLRGDRGYVDTDFYENDFYSDTDPAERHMDIEELAQLHPWAAANFPE